jgi:hypothetical protein
MEITLSTCQILNPASFLPEAEGNPEHSCEEVLMENCATQPDLTDQPLKTPDLDLYTWYAPFEDLKHIKTRRV